MNARDMTVNAGYEPAPKGRWISHLADRYPSGGALMRASPLLPEGLSRLNALDGLSGNDQVILSRIQACTYDKVFAMLTGAAKRESDGRAGGNNHMPVIGEATPTAYSWAAQGWSWGSLACDKPRWAVLAFACHRRYTVQAHYRQSRAAGNGLNEEGKRKFLLHWQAENKRSAEVNASWRNANGQMTTEQRDLGVEAYIEILLTLDSLLWNQARADGECFEEICHRHAGSASIGAVSNVLRQSYRWQFILSALQEPRFQQAMASVVSDTQAERIGRALITVI